VLANGRSCSQSAPTINVGLPEVLREEIHAALDAFSLSPLPIAAPGLDNLAARAAYARGWAGARRLDRGAGRRSASEMAERLH
jgi:hypothetical protein